MEPGKGPATRTTAPYFRATADGFLVWGSFPRLVRTESKVEPLGLTSRVIAPRSRTDDTWVHSFGSIRGYMQLSPPPPPGRFGSLVTSSILAARLVRTGSKVDHTGTTPYFRAEGNG